MAKRAVAREKIIGAALTTLTTEGYAGASARAIARTGGFNPGLIYYHFEDLDDLFLAAIDLTSAARIAGYREVVDKAGTASDLVESLRVLYRQDVAAGHVAAIQQLVAGAALSPKLGPQIVQRMDPWIDYCETVAKRFLDDTPFASLLDARDVAFAVVALYLGMETLTHLDPDRSRAAHLFDAAAKFAPLFDSLPAGAMP